MATKDNEGNKGEVTDITKVTIYCQIYKRVPKLCRRIVDGSYGFAAPKLCGWVGTVAMAAPCQSCAYDSETVAMALSRQSCADDLETVAMALSRQSCADDSETVAMALRCQSCADVSGR